MNKEPTKHIAITEIIAEMKYVAKQVMGDTPKALSITFLKALTTG